MSLGIDPKLRAAVDQEIANVLEEVRAFRHERHKNPELTWKEHDTAKAVAAKLKDLGGMKIQEGRGRLGIVAVIEGEAGPGPTVGLRADMDALPVRETTGKPYASCKEGVMHACGHDGHMANLLGSAMVLLKLKKHLKGRVKLIFQPAEEGGAGANVMCEDGALKNPDVDVIFGLHGWPELACGKVVVRSGPLLANTSEIKIGVRGTGCHAALPHLGTDQVLIAARIVDALQSISSRFVSPTEPVAVSITKIHGGTTTNVIPPFVEMEGTLRAMTEGTRDRCAEQIRKIATQIAELNGAKAEVEIRYNYPATVNDERATAFLEKVGQEVLPKDATERLAAPTMGGEDFAYFLQRVPGSYFFLGMDDGRAGGYPSLHHPAYDFNDAALPVGMRMFVHAALGYSAFTR
jgi:amidohydrolase